MFCRKIAFENAKDESQNAENKYQTNTSYEEFLELSKTVRIHQP